MAKDEGERRLAAILSADVAGYSKLMGDDERATVRTLTDYRKVFSDHIGRHKGRVVDTAGDSVLAVFGSVVEAVQCATEVQAELVARNEDLPDDRRMLFRIGVNLGDVIEQDDGTIYGDGVNIAARLESLAVPGGINIAGTAFDQIRGKLDFGFDFLGEQEVKNIDQPVRVYRVLLDGSAGNVAAKTGKGSGRNIGIAAAAIVVVLVATGVALWRTTEPPPAPPPETTTQPQDPILALPTGPSIAVLPFTNMSGDPEQEYFADGMTEQIITELARFRDLFVIARNTTFQYKGKAVDVKEVATDLGVRYVLEGSVRRATTSVRVTTQLLDGNTGSHLWAETYDSDLTAENIFDIQDKITEQVVATLAGTSGVLSRTERWQARASTTDNLQSYECVLLAHHFADTFTPEAHLAARDCLERTIASDPDYVDAWAWLATINNFGYSMEYNVRPNDLDRALDAAQQAIRLDANSQIAHYAMALSHFFHQKLDEFAEEAETAIALNPNNAEVIAELAEKMAYAGQWDRGAALMRKAMTLNPMHPSWYWFTLASYHLVKREFDQAVDAAQRINMPDFYLSHLALAVSYAHAGRQADAEQAVASLLSVNPDATIEGSVELFQRWNAKPHLIALQSEGLRKAGLPEAPPKPVRPVIAVLPFTNMSDDPEQEYFSDGITEDIIMALTRFSTVSVIARNSTSVYKGKSTDVREIGRELGARYIVEGSVRRSSDKIRVGVQLLDAEDGANLWAETYDRDLTASDIFEIQDDITGKIVATIGGGVGIIRRAVLQDAASKRTESLDAYECTLQAYAHFDTLTPETHLRARDCLEKAVELDPDYALATAMLANLYLDEFRFGFNTRPDALARALETARRAVELDQTDSTGHATLAAINFVANDLDSFFVNAEKALELNPNDAIWLGLIGAWMSFAGEWDRGMALTDKAVALNPHHPGWYYFTYFYPHYFRGDYEKALSYIQKSVMPSFFWNWVPRVAVYGKLGRDDDARAALTTLLEVYPGFGEKARLELRKWNFSESNIEDLVDGLQKAGMVIPDEPAVAD